jgi:hypothetical protein
MMHGFAQYLVVRVRIDAELLSADQLQVVADSSQEKLNWSDQPNVFRRARQLGVNAAAVGWHHPYCRVLGDSLVNCFSLPSGHPTAALLRETHASEEGVWRTVAFLFRLQFENLRDLLRFDGVVGSVNLRSAYVQKRQQQQYFRLRDRVYAMLGVYHDDGGCDEGPGYWNRAGASLFECLDLLASGI